MSFTCPKWTTIDFETALIEPRPDYPPKPAGVAIKRPGETKGRYMAWGHPTENNCSEAEGYGAVRDLFKSGEPLLFQNTKFDVEVACRWIPRCKMPRWDLLHDTMYMLFLRNPHALSLGLKPSAETYLNMPPDEQTDLRDWILKHVKGATKGNWGAYIALAPGALVEKYAVGDVVRTDRLGRLLLPYVNTHGMMEDYDRQRHLMPVLLRNEQEGIRCDVDALAVDIPRMVADIEVCDGFIRKRLRNKNLNIDSDVDFADALANAKIVADNAWVMT